DHTYYRDKHMPLVKERLGDACKYYTVDKGIAGGAPGAPATYVGMCHIFVDSLDAFQAGMGKHGEEIRGDIKNYTDIAPVIQVSVAVVGYPRRLFPSLRARQIHENEPAAGLGLGGRFFLCPRHVAMTSLLFHRRSCRA